MARGYENEDRDAELLEAQRRKQLEVLDDVAGKQDAQAQEDGSDITQPHPSGLEGGPGAKGTGQAEPVTAGNPKDEPAAKPPAGPSTYMPTRIRGKTRFG